jgi:hypothetical protein
MAGRELNYPPPCIAECKNEFTYTSAPSFYPYNMDRETFTVPVGILGYIVWGSSVIERDLRFSQW